MSTTDVYAVKKDSIYTIRAYKWMLVLEHKSHFNNANGNKYFFLLFYSDFASKWNEKEFLQYYEKLYMYSNAFFIFLFHDWKHKYLHVPFTFSDYTLYIHCNWYKRKSYDGI